MPVESAEDRAGFVNSDEFGVSISYTRGANPAVTFDAIKLNRTMEAEGLGGPGTMVTEAGFLATSENVPSGAIRGDAVTMDSVNYLVRDLQPDGTGMVHVQLERVVS